MTMVLILVHCAEVGEKERLLFVNPTRFQLSISLRPPAYNSTAVYITIHISIGFTKYTDIWCRQATQGRITIHISIGFTTYADIWGRDSTQGPITMNISIGFTKYYYEHIYRVY